MTSNRPHQRPGDWPGVTGEPDRSNPVYQKRFSLTKGAKLIGISKTTLKAAIDRGEVRATTDAQGHYSIAGDEIFQYQSRRHEQALEAVSEQDIENAGHRATEPGSAPASNTASDRANDRASDPSVTMDRPPGNQGASDRPVAGQEPVSRQPSLKDWVPREQYDTVVSVLRGTITNQDMMIAALRSDSQITRHLLTDQRSQTDRQAEKSRAEKRWMLRSVLIILASGVVGAIIVFWPELVDVYARYFLKQ